MPRLPLKFRCWQPTFTAPRFSRNAFETQNNLPTIAGPTPLATGQIASPILGTSALAAPSGFTAPAGAGIYHSGPLDLHARLGYSMVYASGLGASVNVRQSTFISTVSPGLTLDLGNHLSVSYDASVADYTGSDFTDTTSHLATLFWQTTYEDWALGLSQSYAVGNSPLVETGAQTEMEAYVTALSATRNLNDKLSVTLGANQSFRFSDQAGIDNVRSWTGDAAVNYAINPKAQAGLSIAGGYDEASLGSSMSFEQYQGVLMFRPETQMTLDISGGIEEASFTAGDAPSLATPIFSASLQYQFRANTIISLTAGRGVSPSFFSNQTTIATSVAVSLQHQFLRKFSLGLTAGYGQSTYKDVEPGPLPRYFFGTPALSSLEVTRDDDVSWASASLSYQFLPRLAGSLFYSYSQNDSTQGSFAYNSSQVGIQASYQY